MTSTVPPSTASNDGGYLGLENELTCSICTDVLFQPLTLLDCLHTFCGSCLKEWFTWQAAAARQKRRESGRLPTNAYTCPSCRASVRETRPNATVTTLLEMYLRQNPTKGKSEDEKKEIAKHYKVGESVLPPPPSPLPERSGQTRRDTEAEAEQDRILVEEVQRASLRELEERGTRNNRGERERDRDARNRRREEMLAPSTRPAERSGPRDGRRERIERSPRPSEDQSSSPRSLEHQSSLRSLISSSDLESQEMEEEIMRQIMEEGLLDGIDLSNINTREEEEISERIAQAYRRRQRDRARVTENTTTRPTGRTRDRERNEGPPSSYQLERTAHTPRSGPRSSSQGSSSSARVPNPARSSGENVSRAGMRSASETSHRADTSSIPDRGHRRMLSHERRSTDPAATGTGEGSRASFQTSSPHHTNSSSTNVIGVENSSSASGGVAHATGSQQSPDSNGNAAHANATPRTSEQEQSQEQPTTQSSGPLTPTPFLYCSGCSKSRIQYELHYKCSRCPSTTGSDYFALCLHCYRIGKGCQNWYGFGRNAWNRYQHQKSTNPTLPPPHVLIAEKFERQSSGALAEGSTLSHHQLGVFCDICGSYANDCYWRCATCNDGEWGFCNSCVNQARHCNHSLLPLFWNDNAEGTQLGQALQSQASQSNPSDPMQLTALPIHTTCNSCYNPIPPSTTRYHCPKCNDGDYDICSNCYTSLISANKISRENGVQGWRKCEAGHRMLLVGFESRPEGHRRIVVENIVGGWQMHDEDADLRRNSPTSQQNNDVETAASASGGAQWSWRDTSSGTWKSASHTAVSSRSQPEATLNHTASLPPSGGHGAKMTALWTRIPDEGVDDELTFPRGAQITEVFTINEDWCWGVYCGRGGLFPQAYGRVDR